MGEKIDSTSQRPRLVNSTGTATRRDLVTLFDLITDIFDTHVPHDAIHAQRDKLLKELNES